MRVGMGGKAPTGHAEGGGVRVGRPWGTMGGKAIGMPFGQRIGQRFGTQPPPSAFTIQCAFQCCELEAASSLAQRWRPVKVVACRNAPVAADDGSVEQEIKNRRSRTFEHIDIPISYRFEGLSTLMSTTCLQMCSSKLTPDSVHLRVSQHPSPNGPCLSTAWGAAATCTVST